MFEEGREILQHKPSAVTDAQLCTFLQGKGLIDAETFVGRLTESQLSRAKALLGDTPLTDATFETEFEKFCCIEPLWRQGITGAQEYVGSEVVLFWTRHDHLASIMFLLRRQARASCYMVSGVILAHYLMVIEANSPDIEVPPVDVNRHLAANLDGSALENYILNDESGNSARFLRNLLGLEMPEVKEIALVQKGVSLEAHNLICAAVFRLLKEGIPAVVSHFEIHAGFLESHDVHFEGRPDGEVTGLHSMVLIGMALVNGEYQFLLQNWWEDRHFLSMTSEYFAFCSPFINFVEKKEGLTLSDIMTTNYETRAECTSTPKE